MYNNELYHHGILGQKWGVRRFQNPDGTLTSEGKKHYSTASGSKIRKELMKEVRNARKEQYGPGNQFAWSNTIGENSREALDRLMNDEKAYRESDNFKLLNKKADELDRKLSKGDIDPDQYDDEWRILYEKYGLPENMSGAYVYGKGYSKKFISDYGRNISIGYIKDLGFDDSSAEYLANKILKDTGRLVGYIR